MGKLFFGLAFRAIGLFVMVIGILAMLLFGFQGIREAIEMAGPSRTNLIIWTLQYGGATFVAGLLLYLLGRWLVRSAPPLEEAQLPSDIRDAP